MLHRDTDAFFAVKCHSLYYSVHVDCFDWMETSQCRPSLLGGELPMNDALCCIPLSLLGFDPLVQRLKVSDGSREAAPLKDTDLAHVQSTAVPGHVV
jgi:hypothetical protein